MMGRRELLHHGWCALLLTFVFAAAVLGGPIRGLDPAEAGLYRGTAFACKDESTEVPWARVNDDYCDCPDGSDEPGTRNGSFYCANAGSLPSTLFSSRVDDGICDCCDGSDEGAGLCENTCEEEGRDVTTAARVELATVKAGLVKRGSLEAEGTGHLQQLQADLAAARSRVDEAEALALAATAGTDEAKAAAEGADKVIAAYKKQRRQARMAEQLQHEAAVAAREAEAAVHAAADAENNADAEAKVKAREVQEYLVSLGAVDRTDLIEMPDPPHQGNEEKDVEGEKEQMENGGEEEEEEEEELDPTAMPPEVRAAWDAQAALDNARTRDREASRELKDAQDDVKAKQALIDADYGPGRMYAALAGECYTLDADSYTYKLCLFEDAFQGSTKLGKWQGWADEQRTMLFTSGTRCWNGPDRSATVHLECGVELVLLEVSEPNVCEYHMRLSSPSACSQERAAELEALLGRIPAPASLQDDILYF